MSALLVRGAGAALALSAMALAIPGSAAATDDYTLPYYNPDFELSYGLDRDPRWGVQLDWTGKTWLDGEPHYGRVYDNHTGLDYPMPLLTPVASAKRGTVVDVEGGYGTEEFGPYGNFVMLQHADGRWTLYYHLASRADGGIIAKVGETLPAGSNVGLSGCSGLCYGAHLHFELLRLFHGLETPMDPLSGRMWTTWPGRVPFLAEYVDESNAGQEVIRYGHTIWHWVEFKNTGGRTWRSSGGATIALGTWDPAAHPSSFWAGDWRSEWLATYVDQQSVPPNSTGLFDFGLRGGAPPGTYTEPFNLFAEDIRWFNHARLGGYYIPIKVIAP
jgi:murein DD-endopeptidase MepM/ murein hydrolase activator NlpD